MTESLPDSDPTPKPRGLWSLMNKPSTDIPSVVDVEETSSVPPRSLFEVMRRASSVTSDVSVSQNTNVPLESESSAEFPESSVADDLESIPESHRVLIYAEVPKPVRTGMRNRSSIPGILCGVTSIGLSGLAMRPEVWMSLPASILGFAAVVLGFWKLTGTGSGNRSSKITWNSSVIIMLGIPGMFLGPLYFSELGRASRESSGQILTRRHLLQIGNGLKQHHDQHGAFPVGGTFVHSPSGNNQGLHGWMTALLPFVGEQSVYALVDQSKPYDAAENRDAMGHEIPAYYAAGGDRTKIGRGYAVSHFAGVGGEVDGVAGLAHAGLFTREAAIRREDVTDGLANTLAVGEVAGNFPPWGDPENWRTIGRGLNKEVNGFGDARGNGALFLFADGSVKFFGNRTDPNLLMKLSTRDGEEP
jgi:hypothetical protein